VSARSPGRGRARLDGDPPFLLDEVDAALDDANVGRLNDIVREMSKESQFLVITHNKRTIEVSDILYGVTMEEKGVSKLVSVELGVPAPARRDRRDLNDQSRTRALMASASKEPKGRKEGERSELTEQCPHDRVIKSCVFGTSDNYTFR
jgi:ABC-type nitrate/sulfonate/bicarbonate transport system ATPase subunit